MDLYSLQELDDLKYSELRKLAKQAGLKANLKADRLLKALKKHFHPVTLPDQMSEDSDGSCTLSDKDESQSCDVKEEPVSACRVTHRCSQYNEKKPKVFTPTATNLKTDEHDQVNQEPNCEQIQGNNLEKDEVSDKPVSSRRLRKRQRSKDVVSKKTKMQETKISSPSTKIPRQIGSLLKTGSRSSTPNFKKLHEAHFQKMESIDKYMERKQKRLDAVSSSIDEVKMMAMKSNLLTQAEKTPVNSAKKLLQSKFFILSPVPQEGVSSLAQTPASQRRSARFSTASRSILSNKPALKQFPLSKMNVRFSETTEDNEHKRSLIKTPARKSSCFETPENEGRSFPFLKNEPVLDANESIPLCETDIQSETSKILLHKNGSEENKINQPVTTPFKFTAQSTTPNTNKKLKFDLQASLSRPLGYQPHKGKLKPWGQDKENCAGSRSTISVMKNSFKQPIFLTRNERRKQQEEDRKLKRDKAVGTRRGVVMQ